VQVSLQAVLEVAMAERVLTRQVAPRERTLPVAMEETVAHAIRPEYISRLKQGLHQVAEVEADIQVQEAEMVATEW
jgi:hypothetical protein